MTVELTILELGLGLRKLDKGYGLDLMIKKNLSGGWMTMTGKATIEKFPALMIGGNNKGNNIIEIRLKSDDNEGSIIKLIGASDKKFKVNVEPTRYRVLGSNDITIKNNECKVIIDEDLIFSIKESSENVMKMIKK